MMRKILFWLAAFVVLVALALLVASATGPNPAASLLIGAVVGWIGGRIAHDLYSELF